MNGGFVVENFLLWYVVSNYSKYNIYFLFISFYFILTHLKCGMLVWLSISSSIQYFYPISFKKKKIIFLGVCIVVHIIWHP